MNKLGRVSAAVAAATVCFVAGVNAHADDAQGFKYVEYIQTDDGNSWYDTGVKATDAYGIKIKLMPNTTEASYNSLVSAKLDDFTYGFYNNAGRYYLRRRGVQVTNSGGNPLKTTEPTVFELTSDGSSLGTTSDAITLFNNFAHSRGSKLRIYGCEIFGEDGTLLADLRPCVWKENGIDQNGFQDMTTGEFLHNGGTGVTKAGPCICKVEVMSNLDALPGPISPSYGSIICPVGTSVDFTAAQCGTDPERAGVYFCTGYVVETNAVDDSSVWLEWCRGDGTTWTAEIPAASDVRLTWQWMVAKESYEYVEYIETTDNGTWFETGVLATDAYAIQVGVCGKVNPSSCTWQSIVSSKLDDFTYGYNNGDTLANSCYLRKRGVQSGNTALRTDGVTDLAVADDGSPLGLTAQQIMLFNNAGLNRPSQARIYYCRIYGAGGGLLVNLLPCVRVRSAEPYEIRENGFYDAVAKRFLLPSGAGATAVGPAIVTAMGAIDVVSNLDVLPGPVTPDYGPAVLAAGTTVDCEAPEQGRIPKHAGCYSCTGYVIETNAVDDSSVWLEWRRGDGRTCSFEVLADNVVRLTWQWSLSGSALPARIVKTTMLTDTEGDVREFVASDVWELGDDDFTTFPGSGVPASKTIGATGDEEADLLWDFGTRHNLAFVSFCMRSDAVGIAKSYDSWKNFKIWGSNDRQNWTEIYAYNDAGPVFSQWTTADLPPDACYRYVRLGNWSCVCVSECEFYSRDLAVAANRPVLWTNGRIAREAYPESGALISGKLTSAPSGQAELTAYAAMEDYGDNMAAWQAKAEVRQPIGVVKAEADYSAHLTVPKRGKWFWRVFAVEDGGTPVASAPTLPFVARTETVAVQAYGAKESSGRYDGDCTKYPLGAGDRGFVVFDLATIPDGYEAVSLRMWPRDDWEGAWKRFSQSCVQFGKAKGAVQWGNPEIVRGPETQYPYTAVDSINPEGIEWSPMADDFMLPFSIYMSFDSLKGSSTEAHPILEYPLDVDPRSKGYRYLSYKSDLMSVFEIEIRVMKRRRGLIIYLK